MFKNYIKVAFRNIVRNKWYSLINVFGLAAGMTVCILILLWVQDEIRRDRYHENIDNIYRVCISWDQSGVMRNHWATPPALGQALKTDFPEVTAFTRYEAEDMIVRRGETINREIMAFVDPSFFEIFTFHFSRGDKATFFRNPLSAVISKQTADKYFPDEDPIGKVLTIDNKFDLTVTGIIEETPRNSHFGTNIITQFATLTELEGADFLDSWNSYGYETDILLNDPISAAALNDKIYNYITKIQNEQSDIFLFIQPFSEINLQGLNDDGTSTYIYILMTVAVFILLIASINFMNLSTARSSRRALEIGLRKVVGAVRKQIGIQFLGESVIFSLLALLVALVMAELLVTPFNDFSGKRLSLDILDGRALLGLVVLALLTGILAGSYSAIYLSSFEPIKTIKGTLRAGSSLFRKILVVTQFALSVILIVGTLLISSQLNFLQHKNLGFNKDNIVYLKMNDSLAGHYESFKNEMSKYPDILSMTRTSNRVGVHHGASFDVSGWEGSTDDDRFNMYFIAADGDLDETFGIEMSAGRFISNDIEGDSMAVVINETAARAMGMEDPVGKKGPFDTHIIGVAKDFNFHPLKYNIEPLGFFIMPNHFNHVAIKIDSDNIPATIAHIEESFQEYSPEFPFEYHFLDEDFESLYRSEQRLGAIFRYFSGLAIIISCLGLLGLAIYSVEQRTKEIGVRKVLGASVSQIFNLIVKDFVVLVVIANFIAWPIAYWAINRWLQDFAYRIDVGWSVFVLAGIISLTVTLITISFQAIRAAMTNPVETLRYE